MNYDYRIEKDDNFDVWQVIRHVQGRDPDVLIEEDTVEELETAIRDLARFYKEDVTAQLDSIKLGYLLEEIKDHERL